jgi:class 3 adenylate cyclase
LEAIKEWSSLAAAAVCGLLFVFMCVRSPRNVSALLLCAIVGCIFEWNLAEWLETRLASDRVPNVLKGIGFTLLPALFLHFALHLNVQIRAPGRWLVPVYGVTFAFLVSVVLALIDEPFYEFYDDTWEWVFLVFFIPMVAVALIMLTHRFLVTAGDSRGVVGFPLLAGAILAPLGFLDMELDWGIGNLGSIVAGVILVVGVFRYRDIFDAIARLRRSFGAYFSPALVQALLTNPDALQGHERTVTVLFSDIKDFTKHSASMSPRQVQESLNEYYETMVDVVYEYDGTVDKLIGDGLMVFFGDPVPQPDHALRGVRAAVSMQRKARELGAKWTAEQRMPLQVRIGINSGPVVAGNMGASKRLSYTVLGAEVTLAQRLETRAPPGGILISESTRNLVKDDVGARDAGVVQIDGFPEPVRVFDVSIDA